jgi:hypothetical protein
MASKILEALAEEQRRTIEREATRLLGALIQPEQYVGELLELLKQLRPQWQRVQTPKPYRTRLIVPPSNNAA